MSSRLSLHVDPTDVGASLASLAEFCAGMSSTVTALHERANEISKEVQALIAVVQCQAQTDDLVAQNYPNSRQSRVDNLKLAVDVVSMTPLRCRVTDILLAASAQMAGAPPSPSKSKPRGTHLSVVRDSAGDVSDPPSG